VFADLDPGSGAFLTPLDPGSEMGKKIRIRFRDEQPGSYFLERESLETFFRVKILKFFDAYPGSG
jgi:hypothetical protein